MSSIRPSVGVAAGQLDPTQLVGYEELTNATAGFTIAAVVVYLVDRLLLVPGVTRLVSARSRNNPALQSATRTYMHVVVVDALTSGLFLAANPDLNVGDQILWPGGEGVVEAVDFRATCVRTMNNETVSVPNTELTTNVLTRSYSREHYRLTKCVDIVHADDAELVLRELVETARKDDRVLDDPEPTARIVEFAGSSVGLQTEFWVGPPMDTDLVDVRSQYRRHVKQRSDEGGLTLGPASGRGVSGRLDVDFVGRRDGE